MPWSSVPQPPLEGHIKIDPPPPVPWEFSGAGGGNHGDQPMSYDIMLVTSQPQPRAAPVSFDHRHVARIRGRRDISTWASTSRDTCAARVRYEHYSTYKTLPMAETEQVPRD